MNVRDRYGRTVILLGALVVSVPAGAVHAQNGDHTHDLDVPQTIDGPVAPVPFGPGERLRYKVKWGIFNIGQGDLQVQGIDTVRGFPTYHVSMRMKGGKLGLNVDDFHQSWIDVESLVSRRFIQDIDEVNYERFRHYEFYPEELYYDGPYEGESDELATPLPLDDIAFVYFARTLPLEVGQTYTIPRYFKESGNPVVIKVLRKEVKEVPAGTFETIVVQPIIKTRGMFSEGGEAELFFTDDERRILVYMKTNMSIGNLTLHLEEVEEGTSLRPLELPGIPTQGGPSPDREPEGSS